MTSFIRGDVLLMVKRMIMDALREIPPEQRVYVCTLAIHELAEEEEQRRYRMLAKAEGIREIG